jgi:hypothetical protein
LKIEERLSLLQRFVWIVAWISFIGSLASVIGLALAVYAIWWLSP